jgi:hypothetical protein
MTALISNLQSFNKTLKYANARVEHKATEYYRNFVRSLLRDLALHTPQYSGNLAASWQVVVGKAGQAEPMFENIVDERYWKAIPEDDVKWMGDTRAVKAALKYNEPAIQSIRWNSHVFIANTYPALEDGEIAEIGLRQGNYIEGDFMAVSYVAQKYSHKTGRGVQISPSIS